MGTTLKSPSTQTWCPLRCAAMTSGVMYSQSSCWRRADRLSVVEPENPYMPKTSVRCLHSPAKTSPEMRVSCKSSVWTTLSATAV